MTINPSERAYLKCELTKVKVSIYYAKEADMAYLLISGGDKSNQHKDIQTAKMLWQQIKNEAQYD